MVAEARKKWGAVVTDLQEAEAEQLPYADNFFDHVICWAVFDSCFQGRALSEMARVLKVGGRLLVTGKNDDYRDDDDGAFIAEENARNKKHPNFFTKFPLLSSALTELGLHRRRTCYFERRGDFSENRYSLSPPAHFYEYLLICSKVFQPAHMCSMDLACEYSATFRRRKKASAEKAGGA
jgi:SAM-dependent methyltransferase